MKTYLILLPKNLHEYVKDQKLKPLKVNHKQIVYSSYDKNTTQKCLNLLKIKECSIKYIPKSAKNYDE